MSGGTVSDVTESAGGGGVYVCVCADKEYTESIHGNASRHHRQ